MTEDDTFNKLKKWSFEEVVAAVRNAQNAHTIRYTIFDIYPTGWTWDELISNGCVERMLQERA